MKECSTVVVDCRSLGCFQGKFHGHGGMILLRWLWLQLFDLG